MNIGRNDPCPCGSGKKYKKCCLAKDEEAERKQAAKAPIAVAEPITADKVEHPKPSPDPNIEAWNERYDEFEEADYEERIALFHRTLDEPELMDDEMAFEMLCKLYEETAEHGERERFDALAEALRVRAPKAYEKEAGNILDWRMSNAMIAKRPDLVDLLAREFALVAHKEIDTWTQVEARLAYYGYLPTLIEVMRLAWPAVRESKDVVAWGKDEFRDHGCQYETLHYIEQTDAPDPTDPALLERIRFFAGDDFEADRFAGAFGSLTGRKDRQWTMDDFDPRQVPAGEEKGGAARAVEQNLMELLAQFVRYAHDSENVPYSKAEAARGEIFSLITKQCERSVSGKDSGKKNKPVAHPLCPNPDRLNAHLEQYESIFSYQPHRALGLMEMIPVWMRFLQSRGLVDATLRKQTLDELKHVAANLLDGLDVLPGDSALSNALEQWPEQIEKEPPMMN